MEAYLDNSATTRTADPVVQIMIEAMQVNYGNPSAKHMKGVEAESYVKEAASIIAKSLKVLDKEILLGSGEIEANTTIIADVFESFIGAMYLDCGLDVTKDFVMKVILPYINGHHDFLHDYKSELQELVQTVRKSVVYEIIDEEGPAHERMFTSTSVRTIWSRPMATATKRGTPSTRCRPPMKRNGRS